MKTAFLFPGQGAQYPGMAKDLYEASAPVRELFEAAGRVTGKDMGALLFDGTEEDLKSTDNTQIAVTLANMSAALYLRENGIEADMCAGFSVGEYAALFEAGVLSVEDVFRAVVLRGRIMEAGARESDGPEGPSAMSAILGLSYDEAAAVIAGLNTDRVFIANHNSPIQVVIAGTAAGLAAAEIELEKAGAMKIVRLKVSGPFHCPLLENARSEFEKAVADLDFRDPVKPLFSNVTGAAIESGAEARRLAGLQIVSSVRWVDCMGAVLAQGVQRVLEVGPGRVLTGLWKSFTKDFKALPAGTADAIDTLMDTTV